jgi:DNA-binding beta-propeller fold protein YncE
MRLLIGITAAAALFMATTAHAAITPLGQYGSTEGGEAGQLDDPLDVAIDPQTGDVYVADDSNYRITAFAADGTFLRAFGKDVIPGGATGTEVCTAATTCQKGDGGTGPGEFDGVEGVEVGENGLVYAAEYGNQRISTFSREGQFIRAFGNDVVPGGGTGFEVCTDACKAGVSGDNAGGINNPWGMAWGPVDGNLYVTDVSNERISVYTPDGGFVHAFGADVVPGGGTGFEVCTTASGCQGGDPSVAGGMNAPEGIDFDPAGNAWVAEYGGNRISVFAMAPAPVFEHAFGHDVIPGGPTGFEVCTTASGCQDGTSGSLAGQFSQPQGVAVDLLGNGYVADANNQRTQTFSSQPAFLNAFGVGVDPLAPGAFAVCTTNCTQGVSSALAGGFDDPYAPADDCRGGVYVTDIGNARIQRFGEPGTAVGPCGLSVTGVTRDKRKGTATIALEVPQPGTVTLSGKGLKTKTVDHAGLIGPETVKVQAKGKTKRKLKAKGKRKVNARMIFTPDAVGADAPSVDQKLKLKRKRKR